MIWGRHVILSFSTPNVTCLPVLSDGCGDGSGSGGGGGGIRGGGGIIGGGGVLMGGGCEDSICWVGIMGQGGGACNVCICYAFEDFVDAQSLAQVFTSYNLCCQVWGCHGC